MHIQGAISFDQANNAGRLLEIFCEMGGNIGSV